MRLIPALSLTLLLSSAPAQTTTIFTDPANLRGERVKARDGRELPVDQGAAGLEQMLRRLKTRASLMLIVAHPDDEDGGMLTYYSRGQGARVAMLTLNRGEGGQNAMTGDFEDALGLLRTQELLSADRYFGIDQMFGTEVDFGFSKTKEEAFAKWTHERVLYDAVRAVRLYRPLVIAAVFIGGVTDGHGQHQVSGQIAQEVFKAAGDPKIFPDLTAEGILPWQPLKVYARVPMQAITDNGLFDYATNQYTEPRFENYVTGEVTTTPPSVNVTVHEGTPDSLLRDAEGKPLTYVQFARTGLALQKSQIGPGMRTPPAGKFDVSYHLYGSMLPVDKQKQEEEGFFDGIDTSLEGIASLAPGAPKYLAESLTLLEAQIAQIAAQIDPMRPQKSAPQLAECLQQTDVLLSRIEKESFDAEQRASVLHELRTKRVQMNDALALALGLRMNATTTGTELMTGNGVSVWSQVHSESSEALRGTAAWLTNSAGAIAKGEDVSADRNQVTNDRPLTRTMTANDQFTSLVTRPYFYRKSIEDPVYQLNRPELRDAAEPPPALAAWATMEYRGVPIELGRVVEDGKQPVSFVPAVNLSLSSNAQVLPEGARHFDITATAESSYHRDNTDKVDKRQKPVEPAVPRLTVPVGWMAKAETPAPVGGKKSFTVTAPPEFRAQVMLTASVSLVTGGRYTEGYRAVGYGDLPRTIYYTPATDRVVPVDLKLPERRRIAFLPGTGDAVPQALASIGMKADMLTVADLSPDNLKQYDTVILGVRTYAAHPDLHGEPTKALLDYARGGGNVVLEYQGAEFTGDDAPYPLTLGRDAERVVDETDPVQLLDTSAPLLTTPNRIASADFDGWVEERGHGFLRTWDSHYAALTEVHDPGEEPQRGGLITTRLGEGRWTYLAFAVYRQLPEAVPGAFRLFVNLLQK